MSKELPEKIQEVTLPRRTNMECILCKKQIRITENNHVCNIRIITEQMYITKISFEK